MVEASVSKKQQPYELEAAAVQLVPAVGSIRLAELIPQQTVFPTNNFFPTNDYSTHNDTVDNIVDSIETSEPAVLGSALEEYYPHMTVSVIIYVDTLTNSDKYLVRSPLYNLYSEGTNLAGVVNSLLDSIHKYVGFRPSTVRIEKFGGYTPAPLDALLENQ